MMQLPLSELAQWTHGTLSGEDAIVGGVAIDSRTVAAGQLFVALAGEHVDGHDFVASAAARGASGALVSRVQESALPQVHVADTQRALGDLASAWRARLAARVIGVTGSNGKTTVKNMCAAIRSRHGRTHVSAGNYNNEIGLPLGLLATPADSQYAVFEMGAGKPGDIAYLAAIARPHVGLVTNIAPAHLQGMGNLEGVAATKGALYASLPDNGVAVINADDDFCDYFTGLVGARRVLRFGLDREVEVGAREVALDALGAHFILTLPGAEAEVTLHLPGRHNVANALAAAAIGCALEVPVEDICAGLAAVASVPGRLQAHVMAAGWTLIDDSYNANPGSLEAALAALGLVDGERWLVLGDMAELGVDEIASHAHIGQLAREHGVSKLWTVGGLSRHAARSFGSGAEHFATRAELIDALRARLRPGVTCLVKGSRSAAMDQVVAALAGPAGGGQTHAA